MQIEHQLLDKLAYLARLEFSAQEKEAMLHDLNEIIGWIDQLEEGANIAMEEGEEVLMVTEEDMLRADIACNSLSHESALALAPDSDSNYFRVPTVKG